MDALDPMATPDLSRQPGSTADWARPSYLTCGVTKLHPAPAIGRAAASMPSRMSRATGSIILAFCRLRNAYTVTSSLLAWTDCALTLALMLHTLGLAR